jgi:hypothetical protein
VLTADSSTATAYGGLAASHELLRSLPFPNSPGGEGCRCVRCRDMYCSVCVVRAGAAGRWFVSTDCVLRGCQLDERMGLSKVDADVPKTLPT